MKVLNGRELASFIKERQAKQVRSIVGRHGVQPKLAIMVTVENPVIETYMRVKKAYGLDIGVIVDIHRVEQANIHQYIKQLNEDKNVHGIIVQLPLEDPADTDGVVNAVSPQKDVDALGKNAIFEPATPMAIMWLLAGYNVELRGKNIVLVGRGKLVGAPLEMILKKQSLNVQTITKDTNSPEKLLSTADIIISAAGSPGLIEAKHVKHGAVVVDAGVASEDGKTIGDVAEDVYDRDDLTITPKKGGVGPLTVCALFENVILATDLLAKE